MTPALVLFALVAPAGSAMRELPDRDLPAFAAHEFQEGMTLRDDATQSRPRFREAALMYDELWRRGCRDPNLALNRGAARRLSSDLPGAIVALTEGLAAARWNRDLQVALERARSEVAYPYAGDLAAQCRPVPLPTVGTRMSPAEAWALAALAWVLACVGVARFAMTRAGWWLAFAGLWIAALALLGGLWFQDDRARHRADAAPIVVVTEDAVLRKGNADAFPPRLEPKLPKGAEARELARRGGWVQVRLAAGVVGWLPEKSVLRTSDE